MSVQFLTSQWQKSCPVFLPSCALCGCTEVSPGTAVLPAEQPENSWKLQPSSLWYITTACLRQPQCIWKRCITHSLLCSLLFDSTYCRTDKSAAAAVATALHCTVLLRTFYRLFQKNCLICRVLFMLHIYIVCAYFWPHPYPRCKHFDIMRRTHRHASYYARKHTRTFFQKKIFKIFFTKFVFILQILW